MSSNSIHVYFDQVPVHEWSFTSAMEYLHTREPSLHVHEVGKQVTQAFEHVKRNSTIVKRVDKAQAVLDKLDTDRQQSSGSQSSIQAEPSTSAPVLATGPSVFSNVSGDITMYRSYVEINKNEPSGNKPLRKRQQADHQRTYDSPSKRYHTQDQPESPLPDKEETLLDRKVSTPDSELQEMMGLFAPPATEVKVPSDLDLGVAPISSRSWIINGKNASQLFHLHKVRAKQESQERSGLQLESHLHEVLALSHVLLLKNNEHGSIQREVFGDSLLKSTVREQEKRLFSSAAISNDLFAKVLAIVNKLVDDEADAEDENELNNMLWHDRKTARMELMKLAERRGRAESCTIDAIASVIQNVPENPAKEASAMGETELWSTFVDPVLKCLLSEPSQDICLRWTNKRARENRISFTQNRPDAVISKQDQHLWKESMGFGEVKVKEANPDVNALARDLLRLAVFSKNSIDANALKGVIVFQVHGFNVTFYLMELLHDASYTLTKIAKLEVPDSLSSLHKFVTLPTIKEMARIHSVFWEYCTTPAADKEYQKALFRETFDSPTFRSLIDKTRDRHRPCPLKY